VHRFPRTFATEYLRANPQDLEGLRCLLRHDNVATTARYVYLDAADLRDRLERVAL
jgi:site-specific recombinase XerD